MKYLSDIEHISCRIFNNQDRKEVGEEIRPAPAAITNAQVTNNINRGTHLLGLLHNRQLNASSDHLPVDGYSNSSMSTGNPYSCFQLPYLLLLHCTITTV